MEKIKINTIGKVAEGEDVGAFVKIIDDSKETGGYIILISDNQSFDSAYDDWVENMPSLEHYFKESRWVIEWY